MGECGSFVLTKEESVTSPRGSRAGGHVEWPCWSDRAEPITPFEIDPIYTCGVEQAETEKEMAASVGWALGACDQLQATVHDLPR